MYDGLAYQQIGDQITSTKHCFTFLMNFDGATKWKSSLVSAIPIYLVCNEIEKKHRFKAENMIFCGVWFGKNKPDTNILLALLVKSFRRADSGVIASTPTGKQITVRARLLNSATDIPAQHDILKMMHHGGARHVRART